MLLIPPEAKPNGLAFEHQRVVGVDLYEEVFCGVGDAHRGEQGGIFKRFKMVFGDGFVWFTELQMVVLASEAEEDDQTDVVVIVFVVNVSHLKQGVFDAPVDVAP